MLAVRTAVWLRDEEANRQGIGIDLGGRARVSDRPSLTPRLGSGRSNRRIEMLLLTLCYCNDGCGRKGSFLDVLMLGQIVWPVQAVYGGLAWTCKAS